MISGKVEKVHMPWRGQRGMEADPLGQAEGFRYTLRVFTSSTGGHPYHHPFRAYELL